FGLPVMGITLVFWGGATETRANAKGPLAEFVVSAVGPLTTLVLAGIFAAAATAMGPGLTREIVRQLAGLNLLIGAINLLPGFPLDGGRMLQAATWGATHDRRTAVKVAGYGAVAVGALMIGAAVLSFSNGTGLWLFLGYLGFVMLSTGRGTPLRPVREGMAPLSQTPLVAPTDRLYDVLEVIAGRDELVLDVRVLVGAIGTADIDRWFRERSQGVATASGEVPPRPDL